MKMKKSLRRLSVRKETLRELTEKLAEVKGGVVPDRTADEICNYYTSNTAILTTYTSH